MKTVFLTIGTMAAILLAGAQGSESAARNAVSTPRPNTTPTTTNNVQPAQSGRNVTGNITPQTSVNNIDTVGAIPSTRQPK